MMTRLIPLFGIVLAGAIFFLYIQPTYTGHIQPLQNEIQNDNRALAGAKQFNEKETALTQEQNQIPPDQLARLKSFLPDGVDNVQLILDLDALAARSGIQLSGFDVQQGETADKSTTNAQFSALSVSNNATDSINLSVTAKGSYSAFRTFLSGVEHSLRPLDVMEVTVTDSTTGIYTYTMNIRLYWLH